MQENLLEDDGQDDNNLINNEENKDEGGIKTITTNKSNKINTLKTLNSEDNEENLNINLTKQFSLKSQNSIFSEFKDMGNLGSRTNSMASANSQNSNNKEIMDSKDRSNTVLSKDCVLGPDTASMELKNEIIRLNPDLVLPPLLNKRTKLFKDMTYEEILRVEKSEISKPLLKMEDVNDIETSKQMFRNLLSYMKLRKSSKEPILHAKKYLRLVRQASPILKDEAYLQVYKQIHNNHEYQSFMSAYKMLAIISSCFVPDNKNIFLFILKFLYNEMQDNKNVLVLNHIKYIFARMLKTKDHERKNVPCKEELEFIEYLRPIPIIVYLFDGSKVNVNVESYTSIKEVKEKVINSLYLDIQNSVNYCLYEICTKKDGTEERYLDDSERVCDIISVWKSEMDKDLKKKIDSFYRFYFRILIFSPFEKDDTETLSRVYYQNSYDVIAGRFPLSVEKVISLASLQLFNIFIDDKDRARQSLEDNLDQFIPKKKMNLLPKNEWITSIMNKFSQYIGVSRIDAQWNYLEELKDIYTYQTTQFDAKYNQKKSSVNKDNIPEKCAIALRPDGVCILDEDLNQIVLYVYEIIINWGISKDQFIICMPTDTAAIKRVCFLTSQTKVIQTVIEVYCSLKAGKTKKTIKEIVDGYDERFKSIDASKKIKDLVHKSGGRGSNFTETDYKLMNDVDSINEIVNDEEIFKDRTSNAMMRINDINAEKNDQEPGIMLNEQF
jgi:hypothetical protein